MVRFQVCSYQIGVSTNLRFALINPLNRQTRSGMLRNINKISLIVSLPSWLNLSLIYFLSISYFCSWTYVSFLLLPFSFIKGIFGCLLKRIQPRQVAPFCAQMFFLSHYFSSYSILSSLAEGQGPTEVEAKTDVSERAFKPMPFLSKFWEIQVGRYFLFAYAPHRAWTTCFFRAQFSVAVFPGVYPFFSKLWKKIAVLLTGCRRYVFPRSKFCYAFHWVSTMTFSLVLYRVSTTVSRALPVS